MSKSKAAYEKEAEIVRGCLDGRGEYKESIRWVSNSAASSVQTGITQSMPRVARRIDNGPMEGFWGILKQEHYYENASPASRRSSRWLCVTSTVTIPDEFNAIKG